VFGILMARKEVVLLGFLASAAWLVAGRRRGARFGFDWRLTALLVALGASGLIVLGAYRTASWSTERRLSRCASSPRSQGPRHFDHKSRAAQVRVFDPDLPADLGHYALTDGQAEAGAFVRTLRRKKWIEDAAADLPGNAGPESSTVNRTHPARLRAKLHDPGFRPRTTYSAFVTRLMTTVAAPDPGPRRRERTGRAWCETPRSPCAARVGDLGHVVHQVVHLHARRVVSARRARRSSCARYARHGPPRG